MTDDEKFRDLCAAAALEALIVRGPGGYESVAATAYRYADAMMAERAKRVGSSAVDAWIAGPNRAKPEPTEAP